MPRLSADWLLNATTRATLLGALMCGAACGPTHYYSWKPGQPGVGMRPRPAPKLSARAARAVTPEDVLEASQSAAATTVWVAIPGGRGGSEIIWVQMAR